MNVLDIVLPLTGLEFSVPLLIGLGLTVGILAGFFGIGGGWIVTPTLHLLGFPIPFAIGTELANITAQSGMAIPKHNKMGTVEPTLGLAMGIAMALGMEAGAQTVMYMESLGLAGDTIRWAYVVFLGGLGLWMQYDYWTHSEEAEQTESTEVASSPNDTSVREQWGHFPPFITLQKSGMQVSLWTILGVGLVIGCVAGIMGCGGGFILVPALIYVIGVPTVVAVGTSLICILFAGAYGTFTYALKGRVELLAALWMVLGAVVGVQIGASALRYIKGYSLRFLYCTMLLAAAASVLLKQLGKGQLATVMMLSSVGVLCCVIVTRMCRAYFGEKKTTTEEAPCGPSE